MFKKIIQSLKDKKYRNAPMVKYWKTKEAVGAKVIKAKEGHYIMQMEGEDYPFPGFPRGVLLFGQLSPLKHNIKNKIFNEAWKMLENGESNFTIMRYLKEKALPEIYEIAEKTKYDMLPYEKMCPAVKEIYRALTVVYEKTGSLHTKKLRDILCFILNEDDAYRMRVQWVFKFFRFKLFRKNYSKIFSYGLSMLENAEVIGDMKERQRLLKRILMFVLEDQRIKECFDIFIKEVDWKKIRLTKADKYFFRAKYFKVDYPEYQY